MTNVYDKPQVFEGTQLKPYPHFERGSKEGDDPVAFSYAIEQRGRERQVAYETVKLLREKIIHCYRTEGVNHYENCREVAEEYYKVASKTDFGQLQPKWANPNDGKDRR